MRIALGLTGISDDVLSRVEFYQTDVAVLESFGDVTIVRSSREVTSSFDLAYCWWWSRSLSVALAARRERLPVVITGATDIGNPVALPRRTATLKNVVSRVVGSLATRNLAISDAEAKRLLSWRYPNVLTVPLAVDTAFLKPIVPIRREENLLLTILHLNELSIERKGLLRVIESLAYGVGREFRLEVIGQDQGGKDMAVRHAESFGVKERVEFLGSVDRLEKRERLWRAGAYVQLSHYEGFGVAVVEAMAADCPVIVARGGSLPEVTGGLAVAYVDDRYEMGSALQALSNDPAGARAAGAAAALRARRLYSYEARTQALSGVIDAVSPIID